MTEACITASGSYVNWDQTRALYTSITSALLVLKVRLVRPRVGCAFELSSLHRS